MNYEIHLYVPKTGHLTPAMLRWLFQHGQSTDQPEVYWPVRKLRPKALARHMLRLDPSLLAMPGENGTIELHYPNEQLGIVLLIHGRGIILFFPYTAYAVFSRIVLGICYTYIRFLYDAAGFWSYDPQLKLISYADDFQSIDETAALMDTLLPRLLP